MLIGLRKAWTESVLREESEAYTAQPPDANDACLFHHERLVVYQAALAFMEWFVDRTGADGLSQRAFRQIDEAGTCVVLNIAEGSGRYAELDQHRFLKIAESGAVKAAVYLDLSAKAGLLTEKEQATGKEMLRRVSVLLSGF